MSLSPSSFVDTERDEMTREEVTIVLDDESTSRWRLFPRGLFTITSVANTVLVEGPVYLQALLLQVYFLLLIMLSYYSGWIPAVRVHNLIPMCVACLLILEIPRLFPRFLELPLRFYATLIGLCVVCIFSREPHDFFSLLYFCAVLSIFLQSGMRHMAIHFKVYVCLFLMTYSGAVLFMIYFYRDSTTTSTQLGKSLQPAISWGKEATVLITIALMGIGFSGMERFMRVYSSTLVNRQHVLDKLQAENVQLIAKMSSIKEQTQQALDSESPIMKAISTMQILMASKSVSIHIKEELAALLSMLSQAANNLYAPDLKDKGIDNEVGAFLSTFAQDYSTDEDRTNLSLVQKQKNKSGVVVVGGDDVVDSSGDVVEQLSETDMKALESEGQDDAMAEDVFLSTVTKPLGELSAEAKRSIDALLEQLESWDFDVWELEKVSGGHSLYWVATALFYRYNLARKIGISEKTIQRFCLSVESRYHRENPFHSHVHAADVCQAMNYFIASCRLAPYVTDVDITSALIAAMTHDLDHPGLSNSFQTTVMSDLAVRYNDKSVLENYHCSTAFRLMANPALGANVLSGLPEANKKEAREAIISMILGTDLAQHFDLLSRFKAKQAAGGFAKPDRPTRLLILDIAIKAADISNACRNPTLYKRWSHALTQEYYKQGEMEKARGMDVSPFMDREKPSEARCQISFIDFIVTPLITAFVSLLPDAKAADELVKNLTLNGSVWHQLVDSSPTPL